MTDENAITLEGYGRETVTGALLTCRRLARQDQQTAVALKRAYANSSYPTRAHGFQRQIDDYDTALDVIRRALIWLQHEEEDHDD